MHTLSNNKELNILCIYTQGKSRQGRLRVAVDGHRIQSERQGARLLPGRHGRGPQQRRNGLLRALLRLVVGLCGCQRYQEEADEEVVETVYMLRYTGWREYI